MENRFYYLFLLLVSTVVCSVPAACASSHTSAMAIAAGTSQSAQPAPIYRLDSETTSPLQDIVIENDVLDEQKLDASQREQIRSKIMEGQIWLSEVRHRSNRQLLTEYNGHAMNTNPILFSPDQNWINEADTGSERYEPPCHPIHNNESMIQPLCLCLFVSL